MFFLQGKSGFSTFKLGFKMFANLTGCAGLKEAGLPLETVRVSQQPTDGSSFNKLRHVSLPENEDVPKKGCAFLDPSSEMVWSVVLL